MAKNSSFQQAPGPGSRKKPESLYLQVLSVAVNYADILQWTCTNRRHFDDWLVVTAESDVVTKELCAKHGIRTIDSQTIHAGGAKFAKASALNEGLRHMRADEWVIVMDADILLPDDFRERITMSLLDRTHMYGLAGRKICEDFEQFRLFKCHQNWQRQATSDIVLGYFQLFWNDGVIAFPEVSTDASHYDMVFADDFGTRQRFLPMGCLHLGPVHTNWKGRKAAPFGHAKATELPDMEPATAVSRMLRPFKSAGHLPVVQWGLTTPAITRALLKAFSKVIFIDAEGIFTPQADPLLAFDFKKRGARFQAEFADELAEGRLALWGGATEETFGTLRPVEVAGWLICGEPTATIFEQIGLVLRSSKVPCRFVMGLHFSLMHNRASSAVVNLVFGSPKHIDPTGVWLTAVPAQLPARKPGARSQKKKLSTGVHYVLTRNEEVIELLSSLLHLRRAWKGAVQVTCAIAFPVGFRQVLKGLEVDFETSEIVSQDPVELWAHCLGLSRYDITLTLEVGSFLKGRPPSIEKLLGSADLAAIPASSHLPSIEGYIELTKRCKLEASRLVSLWPSRFFSPQALVWKRQNRSWIGDAWWESLTDIAARIKRTGGRITKGAALSLAVASEPSIGELHPAARWLGTLPANDPKAEYWLSKMAPTIRVDASRAIVTVLVPENQHLFRTAAARWQFQPKSHVYVIATSGVDVESLRAAHPSKLLHWITVEPRLEDPAARAELALFLGIRAAGLKSDWCYVNAALLPSIASELFSEVKWRSYDLVGYCWYHDAERSNKRSVSIMGGFGCVSRRLTEALASITEMEGSFEGLLNDACAGLKGKRTAVNIRDMGWFDELDVDQYAKNWQDLG